MKIYQIKNNVWTETKYNPSLRNIILYDIVDGMMQPIGIGQY
jgi:hypothetical protein